ncbi:MAG TPA: hypothetical protein VGQ55_12155 [Pyrinomonadaceae bacterium]|jgi:hypothetical protein|nr:hypothetical protein [Pyrinomonadaceae bacterium]
MKTISLRRSVLLTVFAAAAVGLGAACQPPANTNTKPVVNTTPATPATPAVSPAAETKATGADALVGKWDGPEGTYLTVAKKDGKYSVEIKNLDKAETFEGTAKGDVIEFTRKGKTETVKHATGAETGMKGFEKETACVVVTKGSEGFCKKAATK